MDCFIKKIFEGKPDNLAHIQFQKFSKGEFKDKAMLKARNSSGKFTISTTPEYANEMVRSMAEKLGNNKTHVTGIVVSTKDLSGELEFSDKKQFMGIKQYVIDREMTGEEIMQICDKFPNSFIALSFKANGNELKIKPKAPKSKPSTKAEEKPKIDFCKLITNDRKIVKEYIFDEEADNFKNIEVKHTFFINDIIIPDELKNEKDFAKIREMAKKKGKIIRGLDIDGKILKKEIEFEA